MTVRVGMLVALAACGSAIPPVPGHGGPAWFELTSEHFTLWTDASVARGRELVREMEHLRQVEFGVAFPDLPTGGRTFVIAMRDSYEVGGFIPDEFIAFSWSGETAAREPGIVFAADTNDRDGHVIAHELTHVIAHVVIHDQPAWFAEGIAQFFETVNLDSDRAIVDVGEPLKGTLREVRAQSLTPVAALFACKTLACRDPRFYATAATLFAFLANEHPAELVAYEQRLAVRDRNAWPAAFPDLPIERVDEILHAWMLQGRHRVWHYTVKLQDWPIAQRSLGDGDVYAARGLLRSLFRRTQPPAEEVAALAADPTSVLARMLAYDRTRVIDAAQARATAAAHPDDWRAWMLVVRALPPGEEQATARAKACELAAQNPANVITLDCPRPVE